LFGIGHFPELIIVLVVALVIFGPGKLPEIGRSLGQGIRYFRQSTSELERTFADIVRAGSYRVADEGAAVAASCLVDAEHVSEFVRRVGDLEQSNSGASFVCTGPWPPYSFTEAA